MILETFNLIPLVSPLISLVSPLTSLMYYSKLLLFGEHTVVKGSRALAVPYPRYGAKWSFEDAEHQSESNEALAAFYTHLAARDDLLCQLDLEEFAMDLTDNIWLDADIPTGYGLGSSGSVCAAVYDRYGLDKLDGENADELARLKAIFAQLESYFHGASSGTDPLICYTNKAIIISKEGLQTVSIRPSNEGKGGVFLLNTHISRSTEPLVNLFLEKCKNPDFEHKISTELAQYSDACMDAFLQKNKNVLFDNLRKLSEFQYQYLQEMIPEKFRQIWADGLDSGDYMLKLCGAGGGGFMLGFTEDFERVDLHEIEIVYNENEK